jgi:hypothetical protein
MQIFKIVGAHFRPPAKTILFNLPVGTKLELIPEPENPYDVNAIAVHLLPDNIPESVHEDLDQALMNSASSLADVLALETIHLGYIPRVEAEKISLDDKVTGVLSTDGKDFFIEAEI